MKRLLLALAFAAALPAAAQDLLIQNATVHTAGARGTLKRHSSRAGKPGARRSVPRRSSNSLAIIGDCASPP